MQRSMTDRILGKSSNDPKPLRITQQPATFANLVRKTIPRMSRIPRELMGVTIRGMGVFPTPPELPVMSGSVPLLEAPATGLLQVGDLALPPLTLPNALQVVVVPLAEQEDRDEPDSFVDETDTDASWIAWVKQTAA